ncbi:MAG: diguanylate cyclase [Sulfuricurvum sp.]|nr:diguanylate cyclase [Sulfuricurvum sp.]
MSNIRIEIKIIISVIFFTLLLVGLQRYEITQNISEQFITSKKDKNTLLLNTISPAIGLNLSLGLNDANKEYLDQIINQNSDMEALTLTTINGKILYRYFKNPNKKPKKECCEIDSSDKSIIDPVTGEILATLHANFDDHEYQMMLKNNQITTYKVFIITLVLLALFLIFLKREFRFLKELTRNVLQYEPVLNNFPLQKSNKVDEVGIIHNAFISMVEKIHSHSKLLDSVNQSLELKIQERTQELEQANKQLKELTLTDSLTQLSNRRSFETYFIDIYRLAQRNQIEISVIMCDIDHFKQINDTHGHTAGDMVLKEFAHIMKKSLNRGSDFIARYGGEEFVIILYDANSNDAKELCIKIQNNLKDSQNFESQWGKIGLITISFGIASIVPMEQDTSQNLIDSADIALYKAKNEGRNRIIIF